MDIGEFLDAVEHRRAAMSGAPAWRRDCCVFVRDVCDAVAENWRGDLNPLWCIYADENGQVPSFRVWGPALAADAVFGGGVHRDPPAAPTRLSVCQGWHDLHAGNIAIPSQGDSGHTWFWLGVGRGDLGIRIDSSRRRGVRVHDLVSWATLSSAYAAGIRHSPILVEAVS